MNLEAQKIRFERIDKCFEDLKKNRRKVNLLRDIERNLKEVFDQTFNISIIEAKRNDPCFVMSVFPEVATIDRIVESIVREESVSVIHELWSKNTVWNIEIDRRVLDDSLVPISARECTALLLHEVGHTIHSNSIPNRIVRVIKYEFANLHTGIKAVLKSQNFGNVLSLPVADSCSLSNNRISDLKTEIAADNYAKNLGYGIELSSVLDKFSSKVSNDPDKSMKSVMKFSIDTINNFKERKSKLNKRNFAILSEKVPSTYVKNMISTLSKEYTESTFKDSSIDDNKKMEMVCESVNDILDNYYTEFFFSKKKLKKIPEYDLDYIAVEIDKIRSNDDKLLLLSYTRSKIDTVQYYIDILKSDKYSKKFEVPHSLEYLVAYKNRLYKSLDVIMKKKIEPKDYRVLVQYPVGYEG